MAVISPIGAVVPSQVVVFSTDFGASASWTASAGSPGSGSGTTFSWTAPSSGGTYTRITAAYGGDTAFADIYVVRSTNSIVLRPCSVTEGLVDDTTVLWVKENGQRVGTRQIASKRNYTLRYKVSVADYVTITDLFSTVGKLVPFSTYDPIDPSSAADSFSCLFDSGITSEIARGGRTGMRIVSFKVQEV